jgi:hypothetical protein
MQQGHAQMSFNLIPGSELFEQNDKIMNGNIQLMLSSEDDSDANN